VLLDHYLPHCDFYERHTTLARTTPERAYAAVHATDFSRSVVIRALLALRGIRNRSFTTTTAFTVLEENPPHEIVIGLQGPFWKPSCKLDPVTPELFRTPVRAGVARGAWNFLIEREGDRTRITTETRVLCADDARAKFRMYWMLIRPWSGLIRRVMLRRIRAEAERVR
jgi:hypothetical protein